MARSPGRRDTASASPELDALVTEAGGDAASDYESRTTQELVLGMNALDADVPAAVATAATEIAALVDDVVERLRVGGRLIYVGAGSSGLIAALDAAECESTFSTPPGTVVALVAGGATATAVEQTIAEDDEAAAVREIEALQAGSGDVVVGVSASGRTPYVVAALRAAAAAGALTACVVSVRDSQLAEIADHEIAVVVGPEFVAGSTRLRAGTAQKLVLNTISTVSMIRLGKTYGNLMVDVVATNEKLEARVRRIVAAATGADADRAGEALEAANGDARVAIVSLLASVSPDEARSRLMRAGGSIRLAVRAE